jgi:hypothetical protein
MAWTDILNAVLLLDKPWTSALAIAFRDNMVAITEGAPGAPKVTGPAVALLGARFSTSSNVIVADLDRVKHISIRLSAVSGASGSVAVDFSNNNGGSFGADIPLYGAVGAHVFNGELVVDLETGQYIVLGAVNGSTGVNAAGTHSMPANCNALRVIVSGPQANGVVTMLGGVT